MASSRLILLFLALFSTYTYLPEICCSQTYLYENFYFTSSKKELIVGESDTIGYFKTADDLCPKTYTGQSYPQSKVDWHITTADKIISGFGIVTPSNTGIFFDTLIFFYYKASISGTCFGGSYKGEVDANYIVRNDSLVRTRPTYVLQDMKPDTLNGGWRGTFTFRIDNNTDDTARFSGFRIPKDSLRRVSLIVKDSESTITEVVLLPHQRWKTLSAEIVSQRGPIYQDTIVRTVLSSTVSIKGKDTTHNILTDLKYKVAPFLFSGSISRKSISFFTDPGKVDTAIIHLQDDEKTFRKVIGRGSHPFSYQVDSLSEFESNLIVRCAPLKGGLYVDTLKVYYDVVGFNGDLRRDSLSALLSCSSSSDDDIPEWVSTHYPVPYAKQLAVTGSGVVLAEGTELWLTKKYGMTWSQVLVPSDSTPQLNVVNDSIFVYGDGKLMVSTNSGLTWMDHSDSVGRPVRSSDRYDKFYYSKFPLHHVTATALGSIVVSGEVNGYFDPYRCSYYEWVVRKFDPISTVWQTIQSRTGDCHWLSSSGSLKENILYQDFFGNIYYVYSQGFKTTPTVFAVSIDSIQYCYVKNAGIFRSANKGWNWVKTGLFINDVTGIVAGDSGNVYVSTTNQGLYRSSDYGENWYGMNGGLGTKYINDLKSYPGEPLYIATYSGVYRSNLSIPVLSVKPVMKFVADKVIVIPNPVRDKITLSLPDGITSNGDITLFNVLGNKLTSFHPANSVNELVLDVHTYSDGMYFLRIPTTRGIKVAKFDIVK